MQTTVINILKQQLSKNKKIQKPQIDALDFLAFINEQTSEHPDEVMLTKNLSTKYVENPWVTNLLAQSGIIAGQDNALVILQNQYRTALLNEFEANREILTNLKKIKIDEYSLKSEAVFKPFMAYRAMVHFMKLNKSNAYFDVNQIKQQSYEKYSSALTFNEIRHKLDALSGDKIKDVILSQN